MPPLFCRAILVGAVGCTRSMGNFQRESVRVIAPSPLPDSVKISGVKRVPAL